jgi:hypothetical protein
MNNRMDTPEPRPPRPPAPQYGEGAALVDVRHGILGDFIRLGGQKCPLCGGVVVSDDWTQEGRSITMSCACECCEFTCKAEFRLVDAEIER